MSKINALDAVQVVTPCEQDWKTMRGTDEIRFCDHCAANVHNLSAMTRKRARRLVAESNGGICVRYVRRPDGRIQTIKNNLHQITRRTGIAAGVLGTSLTLSTLAHAQTPNEYVQNETVQVVRVADEKSDAPHGTVSGIVTDPNGAVVPFAFITITNEQTNYYQSANGNQEGFYEFKDVPRGVYKLKFDAGGFASKESAAFSVGGEETQNAQLAVQTFQEVVTVGGEENFQTMGGMGIMVSVARTNQMVIAVENGDLETVKSLAATGEPVNAKDKSYGKNSPLHVAVEHGDLEIVRFLLGAGAKINAKNADKQTPLMMLDDDAAPELVQLLLSYGAKINAADKSGDTALTLAADYAETEVLRVLISAGADVNAVNKRGRTALMAAAENDNLENDNLENVKLLLGAGANAAAVDKDGETVLSMTGEEEIRRVLIAYGAVP